MDKLDFKKTDKALYKGTVGHWEVVDVPQLRFLMIDGQGDPNGPVFARALSALYPLAYAIKFSAKARGADFVVPPLEALWWADDPTAFARGDRDAWRWTALLRMPEGVSQADFGEAREVSRDKLVKKSGVDASALDEIRLDDLTEGTCLQTLHIGPYAEEAPTLSVLHDRLMPEKNLTFNGAHHEIYLSDARRVDADRLKTLLRQPIRAA